MLLNETNTLTLEGFEGPIDFLLHLIQKKEIDIYEISIKEITEQFLKKLQEQLCNLDSGAEFIGTTATLLWLKSKMLLPKHEEEGDLDLDPQFAIIHQLIDYCRFKQAALELGRCEQEQEGHYMRGRTAPVEGERESLGIEHVTIEELLALFQLVLRKMPETKQIAREKWLISDKIELVRNYLKESAAFSLYTFLLQTRCKGELIVTFLAVLELMKSAEVCIVREPEGIHVRRI